MRNIFAQQYMKKIIGCLLLLSLLASEFRMLMPYINYSLNYTYIANVLCIEKEKPLSTCYGTCYLSDQLKEAASEQSDNKNVLSEFKWPLFIQQCSVQTVPLNQKQRKVFATYQLNYSSPCFTPPTPPPQHLS